MPSDPFATLDRVVARYRRDVHHLPPGASPDALRALENHLGRPLPLGLRTFLARHNGAHLFRGALRLRSASDMARASEHAPQVVLFADGTDTAWAWAADRPEGFVFGRWDGTHVEPLHQTFEGWFAATIEVLDTRVDEPEDQAALRLESDPDDPYQLFSAGLRALERGDPDAAVTWLERATRAAPDHADAWQHLGDALAASDRAAARTGWLNALHRTWLPLPWPGAPAVDPEVLVRLGQTFTDPEEWERELRRFLDERVQDVVSEDEFRLVDTVHRELAHSQVRRGRRSAARDSLTELLARSALFTWTETPWAAALELAALHVDLGDHDEAEGTLRRVRQDGPAALRGRALLLLGRIAVLRHEPWAEEILDESRLAGLSPDEEVECAVLHTERALRLGHLDRAEASLAQARERVTRVLDRTWHASVALAGGDLDRMRGHASEARQSYQRALRLLGGRGDAELTARVLLRIGDLAWSERRIEEAARHYTRAAEGFRDHELPIREAWALFRLARTSHDPELLYTAAHRRFAQADLATGVAAVDAARGDPSLSLIWHLERATAHARSRYNAQRSRPPWTRSDAERPERRLGAHRLAIAACPDPIVEAIAREMDTCARAIGVGRGRPLDPPVLRYVASADLLAAHHSYQAAQVLLRHLMNPTVEGTARRALLGAVARSANAALVDGMLSAIELPQRHPAPSVAASAEVLGLRREPAAVEPLRRLVRPEQGPMVRKAAVAALGRIGDRAAVDDVAEALDDRGLEEAVALTLLMLGDRRGVDFHARALAEDRRDLTGHPGEIVGRYGGPSHLLVLLSACRGEDDRALGALQGLGLMGDPRAIPTLLDALSRRDSRVVEVASGALEIVTGHHEDVETPGYRHRWLSWWQENVDEFPEGVRYRDGRPFDAGLLIERMTHQDPWVRRTAYDELVITTGHGLPFDSDGPWRVQQAHLRAWRSWWDQQRHHFPPGRWHLDGRVID